MKRINEVFTDEEFKLLKERKGGWSWHDFIMSLVSRIFVMGGVTKDTPVTVLRLFDKIPEGANYPMATTRPCLAEVEIGKGEGAKIISVMNQGGLVWIDIATRSKVVEEK